MKQLALAKNFINDFQTDCYANTHPKATTNDENIDLLKTQSTENTANLTALISNLGWVIK